MKHLIITPILISFLLLTACGEKSENIAEKPIELGTDIADIIAADVKPEPISMTDKDAQELVWDDLVPAEFQPEKILSKYQEVIDSTPEGSEAERILYKKIMDELNNAGPNLALKGKKVRIPGFVSPLDTNGDVVGDFLLVPYFGSCIHSPPPPVNQTVMVSPGQGKSIALSKISRPVWVVGELEIEKITTDLATAGYQIKNAQIEPYIQPAY